MLNLMFWILLSAISFISLVTIWQREDLNFIEMKESYISNENIYDGKKDKELTSTKHELNRNNKEKAMKFYDLEQRTHNNIIKYSSIKDNKRKDIKLYPIEDNKSGRADQGVA